MKRGRSRNCSLSALDTRAQQVILETTRMLREDFLQQNAYHEVDSFCPEKKQTLMIGTILQYHECATRAVERGVNIDRIRNIRGKGLISRMARLDNSSFEREIESIQEKVKEEVNSL